MMSLKLGSCVARFNGPVKHRISIRCASNTTTYFQNKNNPPRQLGINPNNPAYAHYYKPRRNTSWGKVFLYSMGALGITGFLVYEFLWPKHTFTSPVAKILRKALWAESEKEDHNYRKALGLYKEALAKCDEEQLSPISDEYTGIQIKIGEMCERLGKIDDAVDVYYEISQNYFTFLQEHVHDPPNDDTRHIVQKDLRIVIKIAELAKDHVSFLTSLLSIHLDLALHEIIKRLIARGHSYEELITAGKTAGTLKLAISEDGMVSDPSASIDREIWEPFRDEYFNARDLLSALYLVTRGPAWTATHKTQTLSWMILANCSVGDTILNMCNLASLCYLTAESLEGEEIRAKRAMREARVEDFSPAEAGQTFEEFKEKLSNEAKRHEGLKKIFIDKSLDLYMKAIDIYKKIPPAQRSGELDEATVLATYGAGVVHLHLGEYDEAERFLKEAILRAKGSGNDFELKEAERELNKLKMERERLQNGGPSNQELKEQTKTNTFVDIQFERN